jgi:hypothetical protein
MAGVAPDDIDAMIEYAKRESERDLRDLKHRMETERLEMLGR